jgi:hypothetical protein
MRDYSETAIVRMVPFKEQLKDVINETKSKSYVLALQAMPEAFPEELSYADVHILYCIVVNQYNYIVGHPFLVLARPDWSPDEARNAIFLRLLAFKLTYNYGKEHGETIRREVTDEQKSNLMIYTVDFRTSRR